MKNKIVIFLWLVIGLAIPTLTAAQEVLAISAVDSISTMDSVKFDSTVVAPVKSQIRSPLTNQSLLVGKGYFFEPKGDGSYLFGELRLLFGKDRDSTATAFGIFVNVNESVSEMNNFFYNEKAIIFGPALNFGARRWLKFREFWSWLNVGVKFSWDKGHVDLYETQQKDKSFYFSGGALIRGTMNQAPFFMQKLMVELQIPITKEREAYWSDDLLSEGPTNKGYLKLQLENAFASLRVLRNGELRFEPKIVGSINYRFFDQRVIPSLGIGLVLARRYSQELVSIEGGIRFNQTDIGPGYYIGASLNLIEAGRAIFKNKKQTTKK